MICHTSISENVWLYVDGQLGEGQCAFVDGQQGDLPQKMYMLIHYQLGDSKLLHTSKNRQSPNEDNLIMERFIHAFFLEIYNGCWKHNRIPQVGMLLSYCLKMVIVGCLLCF